MKLKDKTYKKFLDFFEKMSKKHDNNEYEIAYSEIQRETGVASITLKKAIQILEDGGIIAVSQGRNTRYGRIRYLVNNKNTPNNNNNNKNDNTVKKKEHIELDESSANSFENQIKSMSNNFDQLRQRVRIQEMAISVILDRIAELEDKLRK